MTINLLQKPEYKTLMKSHIFKTIKYLFSENQEFSIACEINHVTFNPELPKEIQASFREVVIFIISGYTFESASIDEEYFSFEAGFGPNNFGSTVTIPILAIHQVVLGENPIVFNLSRYEEKRKKEATSPKSSMEALLKNPENKKLLKKK